MNNLLDDHWDGDSQTRSFWKQYFSPATLKHYLLFVGIAFILIGYLFLRGSHGSDFDAMLALIGLWACAIYCFRYSIFNIGWNAIILPAAVLVFLLSYTHEIIGFLHPQYDPTEWRWSHYELVFRLPKTLSDRLTEGLEWLAVYSIACIFPTELVRIWRIYRTK